MSRKSGKTFREPKERKSQPQPTQLSLWSRLQSNTNLSHVREVLGVLCFALGGLMILSLLGITPALITDSIAKILRMLLGWGAYALALAVLGIGALLVRRGHPEARIPWGRIFAAELLFAIALAFVHIVTPAKSAGVLAADGSGGGYIGYAISNPIASVVGSAGAGVILVVLGLVTLPPIIGLSTNQLRQWSDALEERSQAQMVGDDQDLEPLNNSESMDEPSVPLPKPRVHLVPPGKLTAPSPEPSGKTNTPVTAPRPAFGTKPPMRVPGAESQAILTPRSRPRKRTPQLPPVELLDPSSESKYGETDANRKARVIEETLAHFGIPAKIIEINTGPTITQFGLEPGFVERKGVDGQIKQRKVSVTRIAALQHDLELALSVAPIRIETPVPGRPIVGIEVPIESIAVVSLRGILESESFKKKKSPLKMALGRDVSGTPVSADLGNMPHLLIAGATGSGKSVCINAVVACMLFDNSPDDLRMLMVDPKRVELVNYNGIPHLLGPVIVNVSEVVPALRWLVREMDNRFTLFAKHKVRNIDGYNDKMEKTNGDNSMPYIVAVIDELADLMLAAPEETEKHLTRLAQMARATGIHLIIATQRPSVDVVTGLIKANFPSRISFAVTSSVDSRVVLDTPGAEKLLGKGDMLYMASDSSKLSRLQGCFVSDAELAKLTEFWRTKSITDMREINTEPPWKFVSDAKEGSDQDLIEQAIEIARGSDTISISFLQRKLGIGYPRDARLMDELQEQGIVGEDEGAGRGRAVLMHEEEPEPPAKDKSKKKK